MYYDATSGGMESIGLGYSATGNTNWRIYGSAPVLDHGTTGDWDSKYATHGTVIKGSDCVWRMWYSGGQNDPNTGIGYATSRDGISWIKDPGNPIFSIYDGVAWRNSRSYTPSVLYSSTLFDGHGDAAAYKMWFTGEASATGNRTIGYAEPIVTTDHPTLGKAFSTATINAGGVSTLTITLSNPYGAAATLNASLIDTLPSGVVIAVTPNVSTTCTGVGAPVAATSTVTLPAGRSIPANGTCTLTVDVTATVGGSYINTLPAGALVTSNGNNAAPAVATLTVVPAASNPIPTLSEWAMIMLAALLVIAGFAAMRRRAR